MIYGVTVDGRAVAIKPVSEPGSYGVIAENTVPETHIGELRPVDRWIHRSFR